MTNSMSLSFTYGGSEVSGQWLKLERYRETERERDFKQINAGIGRQKSNQHIMIYEIQGDMHICYIDETFLLKQYKLKHNNTSLCPSSWKNLSNSINCQTSTLVMTEYTKYIKAYETAVFRFTHWLCRAMISEHSKTRWVPPQQRILEQGDRF